MIDEIVEATVERTDIPIGAHMRCQGAPTYLRFWPGSPPDLVCDLHAEDTRAVCQALGMATASALLRVDSELNAEALEGEVCACASNRIQRVTVTRRTTTP